MERECVYPDEFKKTAGVKDRAPSEADRGELVIITGLSGSGKGTVLKVLEDLGYYSVDNLPIELIPKFAELTSVSPNIRRAALVVDIREGEVAEEVSLNLQEPAPRIADNARVSGSGGRHAGAPLQRDPAAAPASAKTPLFRKVSNAERNTLVLDSGSGGRQRSTRRSSPSMSCVTL